MTLQTPADVGRRCFRLCRGETLAPQPSALTATALPLESSDRRELLSQCFDELICQFRGWAPLLTSIKNEYDVCILALQNSQNEVRYLKSKIQKLVLENGSEQELDEQRSNLVQLLFFTDMVKRENEDILKSEEQEEKSFLLSIARFCSQETDKTRSRRLDRWELVQRWLRDKAEQLRASNKEAVFLRLLTKMDANERSYRPLLEKVDLADFVGTESAEMKNIRAEIERESKIIQQRQREVYSLQDQTRSVAEKVRAVTEEIDSLEVLLDIARKSRRKKDEVEP